MLKFLRIAFLCFLMAMVVGSLAGLALWRTQSLRFYSVQTGSMSPVLRPGDLAISVKPNNLQPGDIISYHSSGSAQQIVSHRVTETYPAKGYVVTKGDNLAFPDPPVAYSSITGKTVKAVPEAGHVIDFIHKPAGLISLVYLPALAISAYELSRLLSRYSYRSYGLHGQQ
jgi:signal peptidase I